MGALTMRLGLDIDNTITADPRFFARIAAHWRLSCGEVHVVTTRNDQGRSGTLDQLRRLGIPFDAIHFLPRMDPDRAFDGPTGLDWYQRYLYGKVAYCLGHGITHVVDDDSKVLSLFCNHAPDILTAHPSQRDRIRGWAGIANGAGP